MRRRLNMKKSICLLLTTVILLSLCVCGTTAYAQGEKAADVDAQLDLIFSQIGKLKQTDGGNPWYYTITDLDHDGNLEFVAASQHPLDRSTNLKVWEVSADSSSLTECTLDKDPEESFPDILTDSTDTYHDTETDTWYYMVNDNLIVSDAEVYTIKTSVALKDGVIGYEAYAVEHTVVESYARNVSHTDMNGFPISPEAYNASGANAFAGTDRSSTSFEWLTAADLENLSRLEDSYAVFAGTKAPSEVLPIPMPAALREEVSVPTPAPAPAATPVPAPAPTPVPVQNPQPAYLSITKNPTNENKKTGGTAYFVACANVFDSLNWTFVSPDGGEYSPQGFLAGSRSSISGEYGTTLTVSNVESWMNGWGAYCTFYYQGQTARTSTAYIYVDGKTPQTPDWQAVYGSMSGTAYRDSDSTLCIFLQNGDTVYVPSYSSGGYTCNIYGEVSYAGGGSSCMVYYNNTPSASNIYQVEVYGSYDYANTLPVYNQPDTIFIPDSAIPYNGTFGGYGYDENGHLEYDVYYRDGSYTTFYYDGSSLTNNLDGSYVYQSNDGSTDFFNNDGYRLEQYPDGSYLEYHADGSWESYDASTNTYNYGTDTWG